MRHQCSKVLPWGGFLGFKLGGLWNPPFRGRCILFGSLDDSDVRYIVIGFYGVLDIGVVRTRGSYV